MQEVETPKPTKESDGTLSFLWNTHAYLQQSIRFADSKAGIVLVVTASIVGCLYADGVLDAILTFSGAVPVYKHVVAWASLLLLAAGWLLSAFVVFPRTPIGCPKRFVFCRDIRRHESSARMLELLGQESARSTALAEQVYEVAGIAEAKYLWLRPSMVVSLAGIVIAGVALALI